MLAPSLLDVGALDAAGRTLLLFLRITGLVASGMMLAAALWLVLAGPGFLVDSPHPARVARRV